MKDEEYIGYKIMKYESGKIISGADNRQSFVAEKNQDIEMYGNGIYLGMSKDYVMNYYSGLADEEVLLTLKFKKSSIIFGSLDDREPELSVRKATIIDIEKLVDGELIQEVKQVQKPKNKKFKI